MSLQLCRRSKLSCLSSTAAGPRISTSYVHDTYCTSYVGSTAAGLFTLQQVDLIVVRLANMGNKQVGLRGGALELLRMRSSRGVPKETSVGRRCIIDRCMDACMHSYIDTCMHGERLLRIHRYIRPLERDSFGRTEHA